MAELTNENVNVAESGADTDLTNNYTEFEISGLTPKQRRRKEIFDKATTALLILVLSAPVFIIAYIFIWFALR